MSLYGAARALWPEAWSAWAEEQRRAILSRLRWSVKEELPQRRQPLEDTDVRQVDELERVFTENYRARAVIGGPAGSGKSTIARLVARRLRAQGLAGGHRGPRPRSVA